MAVSGFPAFGLLRSSNPRARPNRVEVLSCIAPPTVLLLLAALILGALAPDAKAGPPTASDVVITWIDSTPIKQGGNLVMTGTLTFNNGWTSVGPAIMNLQISPQNPGVGTFTQAAVNMGK